MDAFVKDPSCRKNKNLIELYQGFIKPIQDKLNPLRLILIVGEISSQCTTPQESISFLQSIIDEQDPVCRKNLGEEAYLLGILKIAAWKMHDLVPELHDDVKDVLENQRDTVEGLVGAEPVVHACYYHIACGYYQKFGPAEVYYKHALMFLAYSPYELLSQDERVELATNISLAALTGAGVFNFGEVIATPILQALEGTSRSWLGELLHALNRGDIDTFNSIIGQNVRDFESQLALVRHREYMKEKVALLALMELIFHRPSHERKIAFGEIAQVTRLPLDQVEWLVMRGMSLKLIEGSIDQVKGNVSITYVQPRVLDEGQMSNLIARLGDWGTKVKDTLLMVEDETPELFE